MNQKKVDEIIKLEEVRRNNIIYSKLGIETSGLFDVSSEINRLKDEIAEEKGISIDEVEEAFKHEFLFSHNLAKAINNIYNLFLAEYDALMLNAWKTLTFLKDIQYSLLLAEKEMQPFEVNIDSLNDNDLEELSVVYQDMINQYANLSSYKKVASILSEILDAPLLDQPFNDKDFNVIDEVFIAAEGIEIMVDNESDYNYITNFKNLRKLKNLSNIRHDNIIGEIKSNLDNIRLSPEESFEKDEDKINTIISAAIVAVIKSISYGFSNNEQVLAIIPKYTSFANTKEIKTVMRMTTAPNYPIDEFFSLQLGNNKKDITLELKINYEGDPLELDGYDYIIYSSIATLREQGNTFLTIDMIYRKMNGFSGKQKASKVVRKEIIDRIEKMRKVKVTADYRVLNELNKTNGDFINVKGRDIIIAYEATKQINGAYSEGYLFPYMPFFYETALKLRHIQNINDKYLNLSNDDIPSIFRVSNTRDRTIINDYLIHRVNDMKANPKLHKIISIETIIEKLTDTYDNKKIDRNKRKRIKDNIFKILEAQKHNGLFDSYELKYNSKGDESIHITLPID